MLGYFGVVAVATGALLGWANAQPHASPSTESEPTMVAPLAPGQVAAHFPAADVTDFRTITAETLAKLQAGDQAGATARIKNLETAWDDDQAKLQSMDDALQRLGRMLGQMPEWRSLMSFLPHITGGGLVWRSATAATFAASLELTRSGRIQLRQDAPFGPIYLRSPPQENHDS